MITQEILDRINDWHCSLFGERSLKYLWLVQMTPLQRINDVSHDIYKILYEVDDGYNLIQAIEDLSICKRPETISYQNLAVYYMTIAALVAKQKYINTKLQKQ